MCLFRNITENLNSSNCFILRLACPLAKRTRPLLCLASDVPKTLSPSTAASSSWMFDSTVLSLPLSCHVLNISSSLSQPPVTTFLFLSTENCSSPPFSWYAAFPSAAFVFLSLRSQWAVSFTRAPLLTWIPLKEWEQPPTVGFQVWPRWVWRRGISNPVVH